MYIGRKILLFILSPLLPLLLFATAVDWGVVHTVGSAGQVKTIVAQSGLYDQVVPALLTQVKELDTSVGQVPLNDPTVKQIANQSFTPSQVKQNAENTIDSIYSWLDGRVASPNFNIDLSNFQSTFADKLSTEATMRAANLPVCTTPYTSTSFDIFNATCLPKGVTPEQVGQTVRDQIKNGKNIVNNSTISAADIKDSSGQSVFSGQLKDAPKQYQRVKKTPGILIGLTVLLIAAIAALSPNHWRALRHIGITLLIVGLVLFVFAYSINRANINVIQPKITLNNAILQTDIRKLVTNIVQRVDKNYWVFGTIYAVAGTALVAAPTLAHRKNSATSPQPAPDSAVDSQAGQMPAKAIPKPAKKKVTKIPVL